MKKILLFTFITLSYCNFFLDFSLADTTTFKTKINVTLCGDYKLGGVTLEVKYRVGNSSDYVNATVTKQTIINNSTAELEFTLPNNLGNTTLHTAAFCNNSFGSSPASNEISLSYCDVLANLDTDNDGLKDNQEDTDCNGIYNLGDYSNPLNSDSDGDTVKDLAENAKGSLPNDAGSTPTGFILHGAVYDPDQDGNSNPVIWRKTEGKWYVKDFNTVGNINSFNFGQSGDVPFIYKPKNAPSDVGVMRRVGQEYKWLLNGPGFLKSDSSQVKEITFGQFGDIIVLGPWENSSYTNPAVARLANNVWTIYIYKADGNIKTITFGRTGDLLKIQDYDADGIYDSGLFRSTDNKVYALQSSNGLTKSYHFGLGTSEIFVKGDYTGDGKEEVSFWEPVNGLFYSMLSNSGFNETLAAAKNPLYYKELPLGLYIIHLPINGNFINGKAIYTVVDFTNGYRTYRADNNPLNPVTHFQFGLWSDFHG